VTDFPTPDTELTHILVVSDLERSRRWYTDVLGAELYREYGGSSVVLTFGGSWLLIVTGGGPTPDKPSVTLTAPADPDRLDHLFTIRVSDCQVTYELLVQRGEYVPGPRNGLVAGLYPEIGFSPLARETSSWTYELAAGPLESLYIMDTE